MVYFASSRMVNIRLRAMIALSQLFRGETAR
jgi:hypothetical protein